MANPTDVQNLFDYNAASTGSNYLSDLAKSLGQGVSGGNTAYLLAKGLSQGQQSMPIGYNMNQHPFSNTTQLPIQGGNTVSTVPQELQQQTQMSNLASLLRKA